jgi:dTDP-D-glucose 4,6-dehydratase
VGGTPRRCPDIHKISALGYLPKWSLRDGLRVTAKWYDDNQHRMPANDSRKEDPRWQLTNV